MTASPTQLAQHAALKRIWALIPPGSHPERELQEEIIRVGNRLPDDHGWASTIRVLLLNVGALKYDAPSKSYTAAAEFPVYEDRNPGSPAYNRALERQAADERARRLRLEQAARESAELLNAPIAAAEQAEFDRRIDRRLRELGLLPGNVNELAVAGSTAGH